MEDHFTSKSSQSQTPTALQTSLLRQEIVRPSHPTSSHRILAQSLTLAMQDHETLDTMMSAGSTSSDAPNFSERSMGESLAVELDGDFENESLSPVGSLNRPQIPGDSGEEIREDVRRVELEIPEDCEKPTSFQGESTSPTIAGTDPDSPATLAVDEELPPTADTISNTALGQPPRKSNFVERLSLDEPTSQHESHKEHVRLMASIHNRELIDRGANGFFNMETMPTANDVQRRVQQSKGIAALQRTFAPPPISDTASSSTSSFQGSSSTAVHSVKQPSTLRQVSFAESNGRRSNKVQGPYPYIAPRRPAASHFSLGRDLIAAGHKKRLSEPSAPTRFVRLPIDPVVSFKRDFGAFGLKVTIPRPDTDEYEGDDSGSITSLPDVDSTGGFAFKSPRPEIEEEVVSKAQNCLPKIDFGVPGAFVPEQCFESSCPIKIAHAKGPYHHLGQRTNKIMTGLFGHSNPPPEILNAYLNMVHLTCDGQVISPDGRSGSKSDDDLVINFATFHYGGFNGMGGKEFHRHYAGKHISSRIALRSSSTNTSKVFSRS